VTLVRRVQQAFLGIQGRDPALKGDAPGARLQTLGGEHVAGAVYLGGTLIHTSGQVGAVG